jgi:stage II sporulation protein D
MKKTRLLSFLLFCLAGFLSLYAQVPEVRVLILHTEKEIKLQTESRVFIFDHKNKRQQLRGNNTLRVTITDTLISLFDNDDKLLHQGTYLIVQNSDKNKNIMIRNVPYGIGWQWENREDRTYRGDLEFHINSDRNISVINILDVETYLYGVVPSEMGMNSPLEALKAQAVCARTEALVGLETGKYAGPHYQLTSDVMCQVYTGSGNSNDAVRKAVDGTYGMALSNGDSLISAYYASNCGGHTESIEFVWPDRAGPRPYWSGHADMPVDTAPNLRQSDHIREWISDPPDSWCKSDTVTPEWARSHFRWKFSSSPEQISAAVAEQYRDIGNIYDIIPLERGVSGRIYDLLLIGDAGHVRIQGELNIRRLWAPPLRSSCFVVDKIGPVSSPATFIFSGAGSGHGVGMCQAGAIARANAGIGYKDILSHYFRSSGLQKKY